ncbi:helix-turn-helix domain-containing protein [Geosporobacter ferrireducens]|uniref:Helix-turn-helix domain-containing protein n=1 Tax=Geosporobacter ferrireducens TaxID=1424294 RepID=A0A1D8GNU8_9FIRM|nr:helix-turn-helix domain-containing protein [Geosporobacter ferrireducens]AOT72610.1 hypothetical protein Gferi_25485 [Geosporobacter ferrireducens]MTI55012.1 helix-turn-helix domain-containing protein [Geosporobacter ferrireducens]
MKRGNFFVVQNQIFDFKLSPIAFYVYCYLCKCRNKKSGCYPSKQTIASVCGIAVSSVSKAIKQLSDAGLIAVTKNFLVGRQINNSYEITDLSVRQSDKPIGHV